MNDGFQNGGPFGMAALRNGGPETKNSSQASKAMLQSSKYTGTKQNLTENGDSRSFKVTCFGVSGKAIRY